MYDVESAVMTLLTANGFSAPVFTRIPATRPSQWLQVTRIGGPIQTLVSERAQIELSGWADDEGAAIDLLNAARTILHIVPSGKTPPIYGSLEYTGPLYLPDPTSLQSRYTCNWQLYVYL